MSVVAVTCTVVVPAAVLGAVVCYMPLVLLRLLVLLMLHVPLHCCGLVPS